MATSIGTPAAPEISIAGSAVSFTPAKRAATSATSAPSSQTRGSGRPARSAAGRRKAPMVW